MLCRDVLLQARGELEAARPYLERAVAIHERVLGPEHPHTATSLKRHLEPLRLWRPRPAGGGGGEPPS